MKYKNNSDTQNLPLETLLPYLIIVSVHCELSIVFLFPSKDSYHQELYGIILYNFWMTLRYVNACNRVSKPNLWGWKPEMLHDFRSATFLLQAFTYLYGIQKLFCHILGVRCISPYMILWKKIILTEKNKGLHRRFLLLFYHWKVFN